MDGLNGINWWLDRKVNLLEWIDSRWAAIQEKRNPDNIEEYNIIENHIQVLEDVVYQSIYEPRCSSECPVYCCFFPQDGMRIPLPLGNLSAVKSLIEGEGKDVEDYLQLKPLDDLNPEVKDIVANPPRGVKYVTVHDEVDMVYFLKLNPNWVIDRGSLQYLPADVSGEQMDVDESARACMFLSEEGGCLLNEEGLLPPSCLNRTCLTGFALTVLINMGLLDESALDNSLDLLNKAASRTNEIFAKKEFHELEQERELAFRDLVQAYLDGGDLVSSRYYFMHVNRNYYSRRKNLLEPVVLLLGGEIT